MEIGEITINYEEEGLLLVKELEKEVLTKGSWTTLLFRYQEYDQKTQDYGPEKYSIRRYQKRGDEYVFRSKFNISSAKQAKKIIETLSRWTEMAADAS